MNSKEYSVEILEPAQNELENIALLHKTLVGPISARRITDKIYNSLERLADNPFIGPVLNDPDLADADYRFVVADVYLAVYRIIESRVVIYHIFDSNTFN